MYINVNMYGYEFMNKPCHDPEDYIYIYRDCIEAHSLIREGAKQQWHNSYLYRPPVVTTMFN